MHVVASAKLTAKKTARVAGGGGVSQTVKKTLHQQAFGRLMLVVLHTLFVTANLSVQLVYQVVHGGIQVFVSAFCKHVVAFNVDIALRSLTTFFFLLLLNAEQNLHIHHLIKMSGYSV
jgi:hypothetical protein